MVSVNEQVRDGAPLLPAGADHPPSGPTPRYRWQCRPAVMEPRHIPPYCYKLVANFLNPDIIYLLWIDKT
jgi:hypothetical protein